MPALALMAAGFALVGAGNLDVGPVDARVALAANEPFGALALVCGSTWAPELWPGRVGASVLASLFEEGGRATSASVLWPAALAAVAIGWLLARRMMDTLGTRAGLCFGLCWLGCVGVIDHSAGTGLDFLSGLAIVAAVDRLLARGSDWIAGILGRRGIPDGRMAPRRPDLARRDRDRAEERRGFRQGCSSRLPLRRWHGRSGPCPPRPPRPGPQRSPCR